MLSSVISENFDSNVGEPCAKIGQMPQQAVGNSLRKWGKEEVMTVEKTQTGTHPFPMFKPTTHLKRKEKGKQRKRARKQQHKWMKLLFLLSLICYSIGNAETQKSLSYRNFNVLDYGARANVITDDSKAFMAAWKAACAAVGVVKLQIPAGTYLIGPTKFAGPCKNVHSLTVNMKGYLKGTTDLSQYVTGDDWVEFAWVDMLILTGGGTFDGQGAVSWPYNKCPTNKHCKVLPTSVKFVATSNTLVQNIKSLNSKFFHVALVGCKNFWGKNIQITAPSNSPNTDGIPIERSTGVTIYNSVIGTGDDCISIGHGNSQVLLSGISCGPGHGIRHHLG